ncbi:uncharacterized protein METZ01_LOCUS240447, partial [marine metagenome]
MSFDTALLLAPELALLFGIIALILIPNLGDATMRIPLTRIKVPILIGGTRFAITSNPRLPNQIVYFVFLLAALWSALSFYPSSLLSEVFLVHPSGISLEEGVDVGNLL